MTNGVSERSFRPLLPVPGSQKRMHVGGGALLLAAAASVVDNKYPKHPLRHCPFPAPVSLVHWRQATIDNHLI